MSEDKVTMTLEDMIALADECNADVAAHPNKKYTREEALAWSKEGEPAPSVLAWNKFVNDQAIPFRTTEEEIKNIGNIVLDMMLCDQKLDMDFICKIVTIAVNDQGAYDQMLIWYEHKEDPKCRYDLYCDMQVTIAEHFRPQ